MQRLRILKSSTCIARYHAQSRPTTFRPAFLGLGHKKAMSESPKTGDIRALPEAEVEMPVGKKPRLHEGRGARRENKRARKRMEKQSRLPELCSAEDVLWRDVIAVLGQSVVDKALEEGSEFDSPFVFHEEVELTVSGLCSSGEAIALSPDSARPWAVIVPFALPGERIRARIYRNARIHSFADLLEVVEPNTELRDQDRVRCKYFGSCAGCQYQMLSYETQLDLKRDVIVKAYKNFSDLPGASIPPILATIGSPLQYGYRTKLTPHFEAPPKAVRQNKATPVQNGVRPDWLNIGFNRVGTQKTMDIEDCPIATPTINTALASARKDIIGNIHTYKKGVSLLFRDSLDTDVDVDSPKQNIDPVDTLSSAIDRHVCITNQKATVREKVGDWTFEYNGGSFFQNNNSVLVPLIDYVQNAIFPPSPISAEPELTTPTHLVDAYCGAGLFSITLSSRFTTVAGIELSADSIRYATRNAALNKIPAEKCTFRAGDAADIFSTVSQFPPDETVLLIDPPRRGCDANFIRQLLAFRCKTVVYVSCNVHTQARDVGAILKAAENDGAGKKYVLESLRGFDLFPQTSHVESVAVLRLV